MQRALSADDALPSSHALSPSAQVAAPMAGLIRHVAVVTGDSLAAGDLLLIIEKQPVA